MRADKVLMIYRELNEQSRRVSATTCGAKSRPRVWLDMAWCLVRYGARPNDYERFGWIGKSHYQRNRYRTIRRYIKMVPPLWNALPADVRAHKANEYRMYAPYIHRHWMEVTAETTEAQIKAFLKANPDCLAKPVHGECGRGIYPVTSPDDASIQALLDNGAHTHMLLEERVHQCPEMAAVNASSLNTIRVTTFIRRDGVVDIINVMIRAGSQGACVDNWGSGGVIYNVDATTGIINAPGIDKHGRPYIFHPGSNVKMLGFEIPRYAELIAYVKQLCKVIPQARFVGWDIAITPDGFELIEMNCPPGHEGFQQIGGPFWDYYKRNW